MRTVQEASSQSDPDGQARVVTHAVQPSVWGSHVVIVVLKPPVLGPHVTAPLVQALVQHSAAPGAPKHWPLVHVTAGSSYQHPCSSCSHETSVLLLVQ